MTKNRFGLPRQSDLPGPQTLDPSNFDGGVRLDASALEIPLHAAVKIENLRFEERGVRKDFGYVGVGEPAESKILGLAEHKFVDQNQLFHRLVYVLRNAQGNAALYAWDGSDWRLVDTTTEEIKGKPLVMVSTQGKLCMTEGSQILQWSEVPDTELVEHDFPAGNLLTAVEDSTKVVVADAGALDGIYTLHHSVKISGTVESTEDKVLTLGYYHGEEKLREETYSSPNDVDVKTWDHEEHEFSIPDLEDDDELEVRVEDFEVDADGQSDAFSLISTEELKATKSVDPDALGDKYVYNYTITIGTAHPISGDPSTATVELAVIRKGSPDEREVIKTFVYENYDKVINRVIEESIDVIADDLDLDDEFQVLITDEEQDGGTLDDSGSVDYEQGNVTFEVHGFNKATDADPSAGETHEHRIGTTSSFGLLSADAPKAKYVFAFGDRLLALQDEGDPQFLGWCADGDITDWAGGDSGGTSLLDARSDALDDLMALGQVASNTAVLFRKRSMMRVFETGNAALAIGATPWIEGIGTESPLSVRQVRDGVMFLGHDLMVYYFDGSAAPQPVGQPIHTELIEDIADEDLESVDATYDPVFGEYWLRAPSRVWIFSLGELLERQAVKWRSKAIQPGRLAVVSRLG